MNTTFNVIEWSGKTYKGYIHPLANWFRRWNMDNCLDGFIRPQVCDPSIHHLCTDDEDAELIEPWSDVDSISW